MTSTTIYSTTTILVGKNGENADIITPDDQSGWHNPIVMAFGIVGILFALTVILGIVNAYIWYAEKQKKRAFGDPECGIKKRSPRDKMGASHVSRTHLQINMSKGNLMGGGGARSSKHATAGGRK